MQLISQQQVQALQEKDIIVRFPYNKAPEPAFDELRTTDIETYAVRSVNRENGMVELITVPEEIFVATGHAKRIFLRLAELVTEKIWWIGQRG